MRNNYNNKQVFMKAIIVLSLVVLLFSSSPQLIRSEALADIGEGFENENYLVNIDDLVEPDTKGQNMLVDIDNIIEPAAANTGNDSEIAITLVDPVDGFETNSTSISFSFTAEFNDSLAVLCNISVDASLVETNIAVEDGLVEVVGPKDVSIGQHKWNVSCWTGAILGESETWDFEILNQTPIPPDHTLYIILDEPEDGFNTTDNNITFNWVILTNLENITGCNLTVNSEIKASNILSINNTVTYYNLTLDPGVYDWNLTCWDEQVINYSETRSFEIEALPVVELNISTDKTTYNMAERYRNPEWLIKL